MTVNSTFTSHSVDESGGWFKESSFLSGAKWTQGTFYLKEGVCDFYSGGSCSHFRIILGERVLSWHFAKAYRPRYLKTLAKRAMQEMRDNK